MKTKIINLPSHFASAIINHDYSGLSDADTKELNLALWYYDVLFNDCLSCSEQSFIGMFNDKKCELLEYTFNASLSE